MKKKKKNGMGLGQNCNNFFHANIIPLICGALLMLKIMLDGHTLNLGNTLPKVDSSPFLQKLQNKLKDSDPM
jgi:hypothetical protein